MENPPFAKVSYRENKFQNLIDLYIRVLLMSRKNDTEKNDTRMVGI